MGAGEKPQRDGFMYQDLLRNETASLVIPVLGALLLLCLLRCISHIATDG